MRHRIRQNYRVLARYVARRLRAVRRWHLRLAPTLNNLNNSLPNTTHQSSQPSYLSLAKTGLARLSLTITNTSRQEPSCDTTETSDARMPRRTRSPQATQALTDGRSAQTGRQTLTSSRRSTVPAGAARVVRSDDVICPSPIHDRNRLRGRLPETLPFLALSVQQRAANVGKWRLKRRSKTSVLQ